MFRLTPVAARAAIAVLTAILLPSVGIRPNDAREHRGYGA